MPIPPPQMAKEDLTARLRDCIVVIVELLTHCFGFDPNGKMKQLTELVYMHRASVDDEILCKQYMKGSRI